MSIKTTINFNILLLAALLLYTPGHGQAEIAVEQYHYFGKFQPYTYMPIVHFQNARKWYVEARYNYEEMQTFSLYLGKTFAGGDKVSWSFTPMLGGAIGKFNGISPGLNVDLGYKNIFFSAQSQYSFSTNKEENSDFVYSWSELGYEVRPWFYAGVSFQQTYLTSETTLEPGLLIGFSFKQFTIPVYTFAPFNKERYFIVGINFEWEHKK
jgi:hypothetical protein